MTAENQIRKYLLYFALPLLWVLSACSNTRSLPKGESLYTGAEIHVESADSQLVIKDKKTIEAELKSLTRPRPNRKIFGLARLRLWSYTHAGTPTGKGLRYLMKYKLGEPPVLFSAVDLRHNEQILKNHLENRGYFTPEVFSKPVQLKNRKTMVVYTAKLSKPYTIKKVIFPVKDSLDKMLYSTKYESVLRPGDQYNLDTLKSERERINKAMKRQGLFYFSAEDIIFKADSTAGDHQVNVYVLIKRRTPEKAKQVYHLNNIYVFADHSLFRDSFRRKPDTVMAQGYYYISSYHAFKPDAIVSSIFMQKGDIYNYDDYEVTLNRLMRMNIFKFVNFKFKDLDSSGKKGFLDVFIYLTPLPRKSIRTDLRLVSKSDDFAGPLLSITFKNRNVFKGAEMLNFNVNGSIETVLTGQNKGLTSSTIGGDITLSIPRFITPFFVINPPTKFVPKTELSVGFQKLSQIQYYNLNSFSFSAGYKWNETEYKQHIFSPVVISYLKLGNTSALFDSILKRNISLQRSFETQFVIGSFYSYTYNTQVTPNRRYDLYFNGTVDVAGNALGAIQSALEGRHPSPDDPLKILGEPYSQYVLGMADLRHYLNFTKDYRLVSRIFAGAGFPYGNSATLPYIKEFFAGGNSSIRAFPSRFLGPGSYQMPSDRVNSYFIDQVGDIKLEGNLEYRFPISGIIKGAVFTDAGNIWLLHNDTARLGGQFNWNTFYKEIAVGTGFGVRFDANFFVLRVDLAMPVRRPYPVDGNYWVFDKIKPGDPAWRNQNLVLSIGIGYPF